MEHISVTHKTLDEFELAIAVACVSKSEDRLDHHMPAGIDPAALRIPDYFTANDGALVISFDLGWYPFLCNTKGYNHGPMRWYIPKVSQLVARVALALQSPQQKSLSSFSGGRIFLDGAGVRRRPEGRGEVRVLSWTLPRDSGFLPRRP